ncbi:hypothetical protein [Hahella ganghwensis]|uniref:hypothetical protein n=1 Tax=Hahella ganghwensis TaxID=286420 RepID=UPI000363F2BB|nr:hypothetical protein [Hahella ganghwensis]
MFSFFKEKSFKPKFPVIELDASPEDVLKALSAFSSVEKIEASDEKKVDFTYVSENKETRIHVGFTGEKISYVNYLTDQFNRNEKQKAEKLDWFINHYGRPEEFEEPYYTGYMIFFRNYKRNFSIVFGLHMAPIRINNHADSHSASAQLIEGRG